MLNIENILMASEEEIASSSKNKNGLPIKNLVKEGDVYRALSKEKIVDGEYLLSARDMDDQSVSIEWNEGIVFVSGLTSDLEVIPFVTIHKDETSLLRAMHDKLSALKANDIIVKDPFFIIGPPGTGKTKTISQIVEEAIAIGRKVLVASQTNMAVENVFERLDFDKMNLHPGDALLTVKTENQSLLPYSPKVIADLKMEPIDDELELLESAIAEILKTKRDADSVLSSLSGEEEALSVQIANLSSDEARARESLKKAQSDLKRLEDRINLINSNALVQSAASAFLGAKVAEIEAGKFLANAEIESANNILAEIGEKKKSVLIDLQSAGDKLLNAKEQVMQADLSKKAVLDRIEELKRIKLDLRDLNLFGSAKLVGTTLMSAALNKKISDAGFDMIIIDESSMASLPAIVLACKAVNLSSEPFEFEAKKYDGLYDAQCDAVNTSLKSQFVFVGDPKQLSPIAKTQEMRKTIFEVYDVERIFDGDDVEHAVLLDINFRNHPDIVSLSSRLFYGGLLKSGREHNGKKSLFIRNTKGTCTSSDGSYVNHMNATVVHEQIAAALGRGRRSIGVITPYRKQAENINARLDTLRDSYQDAEMQAGTVHRFQGKEKGVVLFDITTSSGSKLPATYAGDIKSEAAKLLNVAMTRAEDFFILVGDVDGLERQMSHMQGHETMALWQWIAGIKELAYN